MSFLLRRLFRVIGFHCIQANSKEGVWWAWYLFLIQNDGQLDSPGTEAVGGLWIEW